MGGKKIICFFKSYWLLIKPRQTFLLTYSAVSAMLAASSTVILSSLLWILVSSIFGIAGATAITNYIDRDIDGVMVRTRTRPLPSHRLNPPSKALCFGIILIVVSIILAFKINIWFLIFLLLGIINSTVIYNFWLKRRSPFNIFFASPTAAMPILGGWSAVSTISLSPILMAFLTMIWIPIHVWSLVLKWREDYVNAKIPMLPLHVDGGKLIVYFSLLLAGYSLLITPFLMRSLISYIIIILLNFILVILSLRLRTDTNRNMWLFFKYTSPYIAAIYTLWLVDSYLPKF